MAGPAPRGRVAALLVAAGAGLLAYPALVHVTGNLRQERLQAEARALVGRRTPEPGAGGHARVRVPPEGTLVGGIEVPSVGLRAAVLEGESSRILLVAPGHLPRTGPLGGEDVAVVAAHRDLHFRPLADVRVGDRAVLRLPGRTVGYRVTGRAIAGPDAAWVTRLEGRPILRLVTCWPMEALGPASGRLVVSLEPIQATARTTATAAAAPAAPVVALSGPLAPGALPLAGSAGASLAALAAGSAVGRRRSTERVGGTFSVWLAGVGLVCLSLLAAWLAPLG